MQINVSQQLKSLVGATRDYRINDVVNVSGTDRSAYGQVEMTRTERSILVRGKLDTAVELVCSRCLSGFNCSLALDIEEEYFPATDIVSGEPLPLPDKSGTFIIDERNILDLTEAIRQYALLAIPMKPLCRQDCAGICPECGHNLNQTTCNCSPRPVDPRLAKLADLVLVDRDASGSD